MSHMDYKYLRWQVGHNAVLGLQGLQELSSRSMGCSSMGRMDFK